MRKEEKTMGPVLSAEVAMTGKRPVGGRAWDRAGRRKTEIERPAVPTMYPVCVRGFGTTHSFDLGCCRLVTKSCLTLCDFMDCSPPGSSVHGFSRQESWSGSPCPLPGDLPDPRIAPMSPATPALQVDTLPLSHQGSPGSSIYIYQKEKCPSWMSFIFIYQHKLCMKY